MPPEILALIDKPLSLVAVLFVGALFGMTLEQIVSAQRREAWKQRKIARGEWRGRGGAGKGCGPVLRRDGAGRGRSGRTGSSR
jgi:hypothetical protein